MLSNFVSMSDRFISEKELDEAKKRRQEEWKKVREPTDPEEVPEEEVDSRPLYDRLKEVRDRKQAEYEEEHRFRNMIRGLDADECDFLSGVESLRAKQDLEKSKEEKALLSEIDRAQARKNVEENGPSISDLRIKSTGGIVPKENKQAAILRMAVKRKSDTGMDKCIEKRPLLSAMSDTITFPSALKVIGVLPGMANYASSSNSNSDSNYDSDSDSSSDLPILPVLIPSEKEDKNK
uniref:Nefa_Nip30_N domain-containing protein n=2 Tax=Wuchereria bancrofti TaxID=6293 RepID=A0A1I8ELG0_WUCBA